MPGASDHRQPKPSPPAPWLTALGLGLTLLLSGGSAWGSAEVQASYVYRLSDFNGPVASLWARISVDPNQGEVVTLNRKDAAIQVFNSAAMQTYAFGESFNLAAATDIAVGPAGDVYLLFRSPAGKVLHLDFKGELLEQLTLDAARAGFAEFQPDLLDYRQGCLYLADSGALRVVVLATDGEVLRRYDLRETLAADLRAELATPALRPSRQKKLEEDLRTLAGASLGGFSAASDGQIYFTLASLFTACRMTPDGQLRAFGVPGGAPGKFGVVAGIAVAGNGQIFVADRLRCVVLMFDRDFNFLEEFGYRGDAPQNLIVPDDIAFDENNHRIYVAQAANQGVSVFRIEVH